MKTIKDLERKLQKADYKQARLYLFCNFIALMLISAYSILMLSPTVQLVFPEGGDSRKQMIAIFVLTLFGCGVFTIYAASLFFRKKSKQLGILMALGASKKRLAPGLFKEVLFLSSSASIAGILAGFPLVWILWNGFRLLIVDSSDMVLNLNLSSLFIPVFFALLVVIFSLALANRYLVRTDILDVIREEHKNEPVKTPGKWCGPVGFLLIFTGFLLGYYTPTFYMETFSAMPPAWTNLSYAPVFIGLYLVVLHTVVHGWIPHRKAPYKNIISRSMMKFQGKQTVNNLLVGTVLIAGACFASGYIFSVMGPQITANAPKPYAYLFPYRADQDMPDKEKVTEIADKHHVSLKDWTETDYVFLAFDGESQYVMPDGHFKTVYNELASLRTCMSETAFNCITGQKTDVLPGTFMAISDTEEVATYHLSTYGSLITNPVTKETIATEFAGFLHYDLLFKREGYMVLDDSDYEKISRELTEEYRGKLSLFNVNGEDNYDFAYDLFRTIVSQTDDSCYMPYYVDIYTKTNHEKAGISYDDFAADVERFKKSDPDSTAFRTEWAYMPVFQILNSHDFLMTYSVYIMMFLFIFIVCLIAACIILHTRCQTIALNNRYLFEDLKRLGASPEFLTQEVKKQCTSVFLTPSVVGITAMGFVFFMILFINDNRISHSEVTSVLLSITSFAVLGMFLYGVYRATVQAIKRQLSL